MKDRIIERIAIIVTIIAILITWLSVKINNLNFIEIGSYTLAVAENDLVIAEDFDTDISKNSSITYVDYINKKLTIKTGVVKDIIVNDNKKVYNVISDNKHTNIDKSCIIGSSLIIIPKLGFMINYLLTRDGFLLFIVLPLLLVCIYELFKFIDGIGNIKHN